ncbi:MAG TPA: hypothetical protein VFE15_04870 [Marmoricola sp.]|jgi:hypothetical protein|nr:hypothetical protein [Marmoricola sp.]
MSYQRLAYEDQDTAVKMSTDCHACATEMGITDQRVTLESIAEAPSIEYDARESRKPEITVSEAAAHLASRLHLHLD